MDGLEIDLGSSGAAGEAIDDVAPLALAIAARGKRARAVGGAVLAVRRRGARAGGRE